MKKVKEWIGWVVLIVCVVCGVCGAFYGISFSGRYYHRAEMGSYRGMIDSLGPLIVSENRENIILKDVEWLRHGPIYNYNRTIARWRSLEKAFPTWYSIWNCPVPDDLKPIIIITIKEEKNG